MKIIVKLLYVALVASLVRATNYCNKSLCGRRSHIGCKNDGKIDALCAGQSSLVDIQSLKSIILNKHNELRNVIASGNLKGYKSAKRMPTMVWDNELAQLAEFNVKTCDFAHDSCHNTDKFKYSGQNLAFWSSYPPIEPEKAILRGINKWFEEYTICDQSVIDKFRVRSGNRYGHFTAMVCDRNTHLGCASLRTTNGRSVKYVTACNYATTNIISYPIFASGPAASGCNTGVNKQYTALCSASERVNPNSL